MPAPKARVSRVTGGFWYNLTPKLSTNGPISESIDLACGIATNVNLAKFGVERHGIY